MELNYLLVLCFLPMIPPKFFWQLAASGMTALPDGGAFG